MTTKPALQKIQESYTQMGKKDSNKHERSRKKKISREE
jgi:hypothetical protein